MSDRIEIDPDRAYTAEEARKLLCPSKPLALDSVYRMGKRGVLRATRQGPRGGRTMFLGRDILAYMRSDSSDRKAS